MQIKNYQAEWASGDKMKTCLLNAFFRFVYANDEQNGSGVHYDDCNDNPQMIWPK